MNNIILNTSIDALAEAALHIHQNCVNGTAFSTLTPSMRDPSRTIKLTESNAAINSARRASTTMLISSSPTKQESSNCEWNNDDNVHLSILKEQYRRQSMSDLHSVSASSTDTASTRGVSIVSSAPAIVTNVVGSQAHPASDFSDANHASMLQSQLGLAITAPSRRRKPNFAEKLHLVLSSREYNHAVAWLPSGRSFCITNREEFAKQILPKFFREAKFESFSRRLKRWGFRKAYTLGLSHVIFSHDLFHRDRPDLCKAMNGRTKCMSERENPQAEQGNVPAAVGSLSSQEKFCMLFRQAQAQQQQLLDKHDMIVIARAQAQGQSPSSIVSPNISSQPVQNFMTQQVSPYEKNEAQAMIREANALVAHSVPHQSNNSQINHQRPSPIHQANIQLTRLTCDIENCEAQLNILQRIKELKEKHRRLSNTANLRGISPFPP